jgi:superfamily I DNA and/or RNA helicase
VNMAEVNQVFDLVSKIVQAGMDPRSVTVLTLYEEQRQRISEQLQVKTHSKVVQFYI